MINPKYYSWVKIATNLSIIFLQCTVGLHGVAASGQAGRVEKDCDNVGQGARQRIQETQVGVCKVY